MSEAAISIGMERFVAWLLLWNDHLSYIWSKLRMDIKCTVIVGGHSDLYTLQVILQKAGYEHNFHLETLHELGVVFLFYGIQGFHLPKLEEVC